MSNRNWIRKKRKLQTALKHSNEVQREHFMSRCETVACAVETVAWNAQRRQLLNPPLPVKAQSYEGRYVDVADINLASSLFGPLLMKAAHRRAKS